MSKMPVLFVGHGSPMNAIEDNAFSAAWSAHGAKLPKPKAILSVSAHWFTRGTRLNNSASPKLVYDMYGFPEELYHVQYPAHGSPTFATRAQELLGEHAVIDNTWGLDHGTWSVLRRLYPNADIPVFQLSVNAYANPSQHFALGKSLGALREEGVLIFGSGNVVHNLVRVDWENEFGFPWALSFDGYIKNAILSRNFEGALHYSGMGEAAKLSVPSPDHYAPLLYVLGASELTDRVSVFNESCLLGSLSMTSYLFEN